MMIEIENKLINIDNILYLEEVDENFCKIFLTDGSSLKIQKCYKIVKMTILKFCR